MALVEGSTDEKMILTESEFQLVFAQLNSIEDAAKLADEKG